MKIRKAHARDIPKLAYLMGELGYPTSIEEMSIRFKKIESSSSYCTLVAEYNEDVVGMIGLCSGYFYKKNGLYVRIVALVVDSNYRNRGIGKRLIEEAESWARKQRAISIGLNSGNRDERKKAHQFYLRMGYQEKSKGFVKSL
ncbi:GNAT family N-acetyltransferase [Thermaerobacillus caldiproteolyticus]|uniref:GNAT family N-acetyltransferase n=1 Tax=Thermaerobacillus caldiproteolyticus TaxID=247480 RepID=UPI0018F18C03|nr:GNAT family N-acetyltransferase [Anoxybacillus caldiproteolyticus]